MRGADLITMDTPEGDVRQETEDLAFPDDRRKSAGSVYTNVRRRSDERKPLNRWQKVLRAAAHGIAATALLAAGVIYTVNHQQPKYVKPGDLLKLPASMVVAPPPLS